MMRLTTGLQINLDFANEREGVQMLRGAFLLAPFLTALFANSPFFHGKKAKFLSERHFIWRGMDPLRGGFMDFVFKKDFSIQKYCEVVAETPLMYAYDHDENVFDPEGRALKDLPKEIQKANALGAMRQLFQEARYKPCCVEVRCLDELPENYRYAATAMVVGVLYDETHREKLMHWMDQYSLEQLRDLMKEAATNGLKNQELYDRVKILMEMAEHGISKRGLSEDKYLKPAKDLISKRKTPAEIMLQENGDRFRV
jgi:glutamate--cysteine ligase